MKLVCERCKASYSIADDKVRGKVVTLRCKSCDHLIQAHGPGITGDRIPVVQEPETRVESGKGVARPAATKGSVLDRPVRAGDRPSLKRTSELSRPISAAAPRRLDETFRDSGIKRREPLDEPAFSRARARALGADGSALAPPAVGRFAGDLGGKLQRTSTLARSTSRADAVAAEPRTPFGAGAAAGTSTDDEDGPSPKTTVASYDSIVAALGAAGAPPPDEGYLSVDGNQQGPYTKETLEEEIPKFAEQELYVWREGFDDWKPPTEVPELEPGLRLAPPQPTGVLRGAKLPAAERVDSLRQSPWSPAAPGPAADEPEPPWKGQSRAEPLPPPPELEEPEAGAGPAPRRIARESSGAEVVSIEAARERAASRPHRGGTPLGTGTAKPAGHDAGESQRLPAGAAGEHKAGHEAGALASSRRGAVASPLPASDSESEPESEPQDEIVVTEPSQVVRMRGLPGAQALGGDGLPGIPASARRVDLTGGEPGVHGHIDERAVAAGVVMPAAHHKTNRVLLLAAVGGALATLSLAGVVVYLVGRGPQVQVREVVRLKTPEELGADTDIAVARLLAEKKFARTAPVTAEPPIKGGAAAGVAREAPTKRAPSRPGSGGPAPARRPEPKPAAGTGMAGFFKSSGGGPSAAVAAPNLTGRPEVRRPTGRKVGDDEIVRAINRQRGTLNVCYNRALKHDNTLKSVRLDVTVKVGISGRPSSVSIHQAAHRSSFLGQCLSAAIKRWTFPSGGDDYTTVMPLVLQGQ